jgi:hypothetical protein
MAFQPDSASRRRQLSNRVAALALSLVALAAGGHLHHVVAQDGTLPRLDTNERYVKEVTAATGLRIDDPLAVFKFVLDSLPERVKVFPTENYFYIRFVHDGVPYAGNIRLEPVSRDHGKVQFGYYADLTAWNDQIKNGVLEVLGAEKGVVVEKMDRLVYRVAYSGKRVIFELNDLSQVQPPPALLGPDEKYLGPIFDESAVRFFLVYNTRLKVFHYVLDETMKVWDDLVPAKRTDRILIGRRTGFAFYRDERRGRKILIGTYEGNSRINNYFDGPFDQLPENFIEGEELRDAIIAADSSVKGKIDRLGNFTDGDGRFLIHPYMLYKQEGDLYVVDQCATDKKVAASNYYLCFVVDSEDAESRKPRPLALARPRARKK